MSCEAIEGVKIGVPNLLKVADKHHAKITFAVMPEVIKYIKCDINHEIGWYIHPGSQEFQNGGINFNVDYLYLKENSKRSVNSTVLKGLPLRRTVGNDKNGKGLSGRIVLN